MIMPASERPSAEAFAVQILRDEPDLDYATLRDRARAAGISVHPIHYGRARKQLGLPALRDAQPEPAASNEAPAREPEARAPREAAPAAEAAAPRKKGSAAFDFLLQELRREPTLLYAPLRDRCAERGFKIAPIMYGRAKAVLGLVPVKPRGSKRAKAAGSPMQLKQVESVAADKFSKKLDDVRNLEQLLTIVRDLDAERRRLRDVIERVVTLLDEALG